MPASVPLPIAIPNFVAGTPGDNEVGVGVSQVIMDRMLPGMDGLSVLKALRAAGWTTRVIDGMSTVGGGSDAGRERWTQTMGTNFRRLRRRGREIDLAHDLGHRGVVDPVGRAGVLGERRAVALEQERRLLGRVVVRHARRHVRDELEQALERYSTLRRRGFS